MKKQVLCRRLDGRWSTQGENRRDLFSDFAAVAERSGVYTADDYADIMEHLIKRWEINSITGLSAKRGSQEYLMKQPDRIRKLAVW